MNRCTACYSGAGGDYIGGAKFSISNKECLPWTDPGQTLYAIADFEQTQGYDQTLASMKNYCRNPDAPAEYDSGPSDGAAPWCYVEGNVKEECKVPQCDTPFEILALREGGSDACTSGCTFTTSTTADTTATATAHAVVPGQTYNLKVELLHNAQGTNCTGSNHASITLDGQTITPDVGCAPPTEASSDVCAWYDCDSQIDRLNLVVTATKGTMDFGIATVAGCTWDCSFQEMVPATTTTPATFGYTVARFTLTPGGILPPGAPPSPPAAPPLRLLRSPPAP